MQLSKSQSIVLAIALIACFFVTAYFYAQSDSRSSLNNISKEEEARLLAQYQANKPPSPNSSPNSTTASSTTAQPSSEAETPSQPQDTASGLQNNGAAPQTETSSGFKLNRFQRSETKDGKKLWEVTADSGEYFPQNNTAKVYKAQLWLYRPDGTTVELNAGEALLYLQGATLNKAEGSHGVILRYNDKFTVQTEQATYDKVNATVLAPGFATVSSEALEVRGEVLHVDVEHKIATFEKNVSSLIKPRAKKQS